MTATNPKAKSGLKLLGLGALACVGCCAGPVLALLSGLSIAGLASTTLIGGAGLVVAAVASTGYLIVLRRRTLACDVTCPVPVPVADPTRKPTAAEEVAVS
jgi:hypothetical protein